MFQTLELESNFWLPFRGIEDLFFLAKKQSDGNFEKLIDFCKKSYLCRKHTEHQSRLAAPCCFTRVFREKKYPIYYIVFYYYFAELSKKHSNIYKLWRFGKIFVGFLVLRLLKFWKQFTCLNYSSFYQHETLWKVV